MKYKYFKYLYRWLRRNSYTIDKCVVISPKHFPNVVFSSLVLYLPGWEALRSAALVEGGPQQTQVTQGSARWRGAEGQRLWKRLEYPLLWVGGGGEWQLVLELVLWMGHVVDHVVIIAAIAIIVGI